jgi:hypothetical protein
MIDYVILSVIFLMIFALNLWVFIHVRGHAFFKMFAVTLSVVACLSLVAALNGVAGWPTTDSLPERFQVQWVVVIEPNKATGEPGHIHILVQDQKRVKGKDGVRLHVQDYSREKHEQANKIQERIKSGDKVYGESIRKSGNKGMKGSDKAKDGGGRSGGDSAYSDPMFHELPPPKPPQKKQNQMPRFFLGAPLNNN